MPENYVTITRFEDSMGAIARSFQAVDERFDRMEKRFDLMDKRFDRHDEMFEKIITALDIMRKESREDRQTMGTLAYNDLRDADRLDKLEFRTRGL